MTFQYEDVSHQIQGCIVIQIIFRIKPYISLQPFILHLYFQALERSNVLNVVEPSASLDELDRPRPLKTAERTAHA